MVTVVQCIFLKLSPDKNQWGINTHFKFLYIGSVKSTYWAFTIMEIGRKALVLLFVPDQRE